MGDWATKPSTSVAEVWLVSGWVGLALVVQVAPVSFSILVVVAYVDPRQQFATIQWLTILYSSHEKVVVFL